MSCEVVFTITTILGTEFYQFTVIPCEFSYCIVWYGDFFIRVHSGVAERHETYNEK